MKRLAVLMLSVAGCGKSFVEADAIHKAEVGKLEAIEAEIATKKDDASADARADAEDKFAAEVERRKSLVATWRKANPRPLAEKFPDVPLQLPRNIDELGPSGQTGELARQNAKQATALGMDIPPDEPFRMEIWTERWQRQPPNVFVRVAKAGNTTMMQRDIEALDEAENHGFFLLFAPSPDWAAKHPKPTYSAYSEYDLDQWTERREKARAEASPEQLRLWDQQNPKPHLSDDEHCVLKWEKELQRAELEWERVFRAFLGTLGALPTREPNPEALHARFDEIDGEYQSLLAEQRKKVDEAAKVKEAAKR